MKVWIIEAFSAEQWSTGHWIDSVWDSEELALKYLKEKASGVPDIFWSEYSVGPFETDPDDLEVGYFLRLPKDYDIRSV